RFGALAEGIRVMLRAGVIPMAVLCLAVTALLASPRLLWEIERFLIGPQDLGTRWIPLSYWLSPINNAIAYVAITCVVAGAVERIGLKDVHLRAAADETDQSRTVSQA